MMMPMIRAAAPTAGRAAPLSDVQTEGHDAR